MTVSNSLTTTKKTSLESMPMSGFLTQDAIKTRINKMLGEKDGLRFISAITSAVNTNVALQECTNTSIFNAALLGESLKLSPSPQLGQYFLVPFKNTKKGCTEAQFQIGYKGYIQLAIRSGYYKKINVLAIKEGELISYDPLDETIKIDFILGDTQRENTPTIGYYAMFEYTNGFRKALYWSKEKMINHADKYSQAFSKEAKKGKKPEYDKVSFADYEAGNYNKDTEWLYSSFWYKDFDGMAYKTMLRQLISKWGVMSVDFLNAYQNDMGVINNEGEVDYVDTPAIETKDSNDVIEVETSSHTEDNPFDNFEE